MVTVLQGGHRAKLHTTAIKSSCEVETKRRGEIQTEPQLVFNKVDKSEEYIMQLMCWVQV